MSGPIDEQLSAYLDGELPEGEIELLLRRVSRDPAHRATIARYGFIGACLRGEIAGAESLNLGEQVRHSLQDESTATQPGTRTSLGMSALGTAIAASVAVVAVLSLGRIGSPPGTDAQIADTAILSDPSYIVPVTSTTQPVIAPARLTNYLVAHGEYSGSLSRQVMDSHVVNQRPDVIRMDAADEATEDEPAESMDE